MVRVERLDWDTWNIEHIARHQMTPEDVEAVLWGAPVEYKQSYKNRIVIVGPRSDGLMVAVVIGPVPGAPEGVFYVFSARPTHRVERRFYSDAKGEISHE